MKLYLVLKLSLRHFFTRDNRGSHHLRGAALGIGIAIVPVIIVLVAGNGLIEGITERYQELSSGQLQVRGLFDNSDTQNLIESLDANSKVLYAGVYMEEYGLIHGNGRNEGTVIRGMPEDVYTQDEGFRKHLSITEGEFDIAGPGKLMISKELARKLDVHPGDAVKLIIHRSFGRKVLYRTVGFDITGIFSTGYYELDAFTVYMSGERVDELFGDGTPRYVVIKTRLADVKSLLPALTEELGADYAVMPWYRINGSMYDNFTSTKSSLMLIMLLIVAIAGLSVSSSVYMLVMEQKEEIAFLKAIGMNNGTISGIFILSGGITGFIGGGLGILAGLLTGIHINEVLKGIERGINALNTLVHVLLSSQTPVDHISILGGDFYLDRIPVIIYEKDILLIFIVGIIVSITGALIPSIKGAKIPPLEMISKK